MPAANAFIWDDLLHSWLFKNLECWLWWPSPISKRSCCTAGEISRCACWQVDNAVIPWKMNKEHLAEAASAQIHKQYIQTNIIKGSHQDLTLFTGHKIRWWVKTGYPCNGRYGPQWTAMDLSQPHLVRIVSFQAITIANCPTKKMTQLDATKKGLSENRWILT